ncbi:MAG: LysM peptidoglycan-binding domain-containing protein [Pseudomonadota bacterium]
MVVSQGSGTAILGAVGTQSSATLAATSPRLIAFNPNLPAATRLELRYRVKGQSGAPFAIISLGRLASGAFKWDASALNPNIEYEYDYEAFDSASRSLTRNSGSFRPDNDIRNDATNRDIRWVINGVSNSNTVISRHQGHNAFGEIDAETDGRGNLSTFRYNALGKLVTKTDPLVSSTLANGVAQASRPVTSYSYDRLGQLVGTRDANGNLTTQQWNNLTGRAFVTSIWNPDGGRQRYLADIHGNITATLDELSRRTDSFFDKNRQRIRVERPVLGNGTRAVEHYRYDSLGQRIAHTDALGATDTTVYDSAGRIIRTVSGAGRAISYQYSWDNTIASVGNSYAASRNGGWRRITADANGRTQSDDLDIFNRAMAHTDLGGRRTTYRYNWAGAIIGQTSSDGQNISYSYYGNGYLRQMIDHAMNSEANYEYDANGNRIFEGYSSATAQSGGTRTYFQQSIAAYDALNRLTQVTDPRYVIRYEYDAVGNRRRVVSTYNDGVNGSLQTQDYWYKYDVMNRFTVTMGQLVDGQIVRGAIGDGVTVGYDLAGQRKVAIYAWDGHRENYNYSGDGLLTEVSIDDVLRSVRSYDLGGRVTQYNEWNVDGSPRTATSRTWDADAQLLQESDVISGSTTAYQRMADGTLLSSTQRSTNSSTVTTTTYSYAWWDEAKQTDIKVQASNEAVARWAPGYSSFSYDLNGHLGSVADPAGKRSFSYSSDANGRVLRRDELIGGTRNRSHSYYLFDGREIGNVGNDGQERKDYVQELARARQSDNPDERYRNFTPVNSADFDANYQPINSAYPGAAPQRYTVRAGDTLRGIAQAVWGDAQMWYLIADANSLAGDEVLATGMILAIPNKVTNIHNNTSTFRPYQPGLAIGDTTPSVPEPVFNNSKSGKCSGASILVMVIAVAAAVMTGNFLLAKFGTEIGSAAAAAGTTAGAGTAGAVYTTGSYIMAGAVGSAAGSIASQAAAIAGGLQSRMNLRAVGLAALSGGITAGLMKVPLLDGTASSLVNSMAITGARAALGSVITQGTGVALGMQERFSWKDVAATAVGAAAGHFVGEGLGLTKNGQRVLRINPGERFLKTSLANFSAGMMTASMHRDGFSTRQIMADAFGNTLGNSFAERLANYSLSNDNAPEPLLEGNGLFEGSDENRAILSDRYIPFVELPDRTLYFASLDGDGQFARVKGSTVATLKSYRAEDGSIAYASADEHGYYPVPAGLQTVDVQELRYGDKILGRDYGPVREGLEAAYERNVFAGDPIRSVRRQVMVDVIAHPGLGAFIDPGTGQVNPLQWGEFEAAAMKAGIAMLVSSNGMTNFYQQARDNIRILAEGKDVLAVNVYNPTFDGSARNDTIREAGFANLLRQEQTVQVAIELQMMSALAYNAELDKELGRPIGTTLTDYVGHSQGTINGNLAIQRMSADEKRNIRVFNIGPASLHMSTGVAEFISIYDKNDIVPKLTFGNAIHNTLYAREHPGRHLLLETDIKQIPGLRDAGNHHSFYLYAQTREFQKILNFVPRAAPILMTRPFAGK